MCIKCEMRKLAAAAAGIEEVEIVIGTSDPLLTKQLEKATDSLEALKDQFSAELQQEVDIVVEQVKAQLEAKYRKQIETGIANIESIQDAILVKAGLSEEELLSDENLLDVGINIKKREIIKRVAQPVKTAQGVH